MGPGPPGQVGHLILFKHIQSKGRLARSSTSDHYRLGVETLALISPGMLPTQRVTGLLPHRIVTGNELIK